MIDQIDWDGALTHRIGKIHEVGLFNLKRKPDGELVRIASPLVEQFRQFAASGETHVGRLERINHPSPEAEDAQLPPIGEWMQPTLATDNLVRMDDGSARARSSSGNGHASNRGNGNGGATDGPSGFTADPTPTPLADNAGCN